MSKTYRRSRQRRNKLSKKRGGGPKSQRPGSQVEIKYVGRPNFMLDTPPKSSDTPPESSYAVGYQPARIVHRTEGNKIIFVIPTREGVKKELHMTLTFHEELLRETYGNFKKVQDYFIRTNITNKKWVRVTPSVGNNRSGYFAVIPAKITVVNDENINSPDNIKKINQDNEKGIFWFPKNYDILEPALIQGMIQEKKPDERGILWLPDESWPEIPTFESISKVIASRTSHAPTASRAPAASRLIKPSISKQPM